ncbi:hypothetical protein COA01_30095 [Bacillus cereus]|uniref:hypothetical protein n=1 Tax=Bacillus cereus TaxID=1396 RepID=UPI000BFB2DD3|nr:hypothetical protein [Bacillus cereus]PGP14607.1 hypothetical protein COA01_30095 [Bacillus cereus]
MHIKYSEEESRTVIYPKVKQDSNFNPLHNASAVITEHMNSVTILHRLQNDEGRWKMVQFSAMNKQELQQYIDELQKICNRIG